ncbi:MAG: hemerythrin domain-containing protein [Prolixibacteraceae bacterium]|jgi:hypothetical protein
METIKLFSAPHKALRKIMAEFSVLAGQTNFSNQPEIEKLKELGNVFFALLSLHTGTEDKIILSALDARLPGASAHDKAEHVEIEKFQQELESEMQNLSTRTTQEEGYQFYLQVSKFQSIYLNHMLEEETVTQKMIWENLSADEQLAVRIAIVQKMDPEIYALWLKYMIPAQNEAENLPMLGVIRMNMPPERYTSLLQNLKEQMPAKTFGSLMEKVTASAFQN